MHARELTVLVMALAMSIAVFAGEKQHTKIQIAVEGDEGETEFSFDSEDAGFNLHDLEVGDTRSFATEDGGEALVTRNKDGFEFDVGGQKIDVQDLHEMHEPHTGGADAVTIVTGTPLDEATKQKLREVLADSGATGEVLFVDGAKHEQRREVRIIKKEIEVTD